MCRRDSYFHALEARQDVDVIMEGKRRIMLGSNNYLGLTTDPAVVEAGVKALEQYGTGCSGSRFLNGTLEMHLELEDALAKFLRKPGIVTFGTGFQSNVGIISALVGRHDYVICDRENHASIYAGCQLSYGKMLRYRHSDMAELEKCLQKVPETEVYKRQAPYAVAVHPGAERLRLAGKADHGPAHEPGQRRKKHHKYGSCRDRQRFFLFLRQGAFHGYMPFSFVLPTAYHVFNRII